MKLNLAGKYVVVTGASRGIGLATAREFAKEGCKVVMVARPDGPLHEEVQAIKNDFFADVVGLGADLSLASGLEHLWRNIDVPDIFVNNAGAVTRGGIADLSNEQLRSDWDLKVFAYLENCRRALAGMSKRQSGVIINIIGNAEQRPRPDYISAAAANSMLAATTRAMGSTSLARGIRIVGINPGRIETDRLKKRLQNKNLRPVKKVHERGETGEEFPLGQPHHVAAVATFLASEIAAHISGTIITVDGGAAGR